MTGAGFKYGGFWRRLAALLLDSLIMFPLVVVVLYGQTYSRYFWVLYLPLEALITLSYSVYLVRRFGGTPGKLIVGLRILKRDGEPIGYREATLRFLPEFLFAFAACTGLAIAALRMSDAEYFSLSIFELQPHIEKLAPAWDRWVNILNQVWIWGELIVLLTNRKRRALHDFIAGTIVVVRGTVPKDEPAMAQSAAG